MTLMDDITKSTFNQKGQTKATELQFARIASFASLRIEDARIYTSKKVCPICPVGVWAPCTRITRSDAVLLEY